MTVAALYDIHGNLPALEAVLEDVRRARVDRIVVGGDVLPGPLPRETLDCLLNLDIPVQFIRGNGDREVLARKAGIETGAIPEPFREVIRWNAEQLTPEHERDVASWPLTLRLAIPGLDDVLFCHATPRNDSRGPRTTSGSSSHGAFAEASEADVTRTMLYTRHGGAGL